MTNQDLVNYIVLLMSELKRCAVKIDAYREWLQND